MMVQRFRKAVSAPVADGKAIFSYSAANNNPTVAYAFVADIEKLLSGQAPSRNNEIAAEETERLERYRIDRALSHSADYPLPAPGVYIDVEMEKGQVTDASYGLYARSQRLISALRDKGAESLPFIAVTHRADLVNQLADYLDAGPVEHVAEWDMKSDTPAVGTGWTQGIPLSDLLDLTRSRSHFYEHSLASLHQEMQHREDDSLNAAFRQDRLKEAEDNLGVYMLCLSLAEEAACRGVPGITVSEWWKSEDLARATETALQHHPSPATDADATELVSRFAYCMEALAYRKQNKLISESDIRRLDNNAAVLARAIRQADPNFSTARQYLNADLIKQIDARSGPARPSGLTIG